MSVYTKLIPQNVAPTGFRRIAIYDEHGMRCGQIPLDSLTPPNRSKKLYSFGALSDVHLQYSTAQADFQAALTYLNETEDVALTCICGDLTDTGTEANLGVFKTYVETYSPNTPVYAVMGNHDGVDGEWHTMTVEQIQTLAQTYTGHPLWYSFNQGDDVYIMLGYCGYGRVFTTEELQWFYETLEANRNKRCFVFFHILHQNSSGDVMGLYTHDKLGTDTKSRVFTSLLSHYKNAIWFHGHSHMKFNQQAHGTMANYDNTFGVHSVHIPSLAVPRDDVDGDGDYDDIYADSEGYVVDVYENGIHLRGRDFVKGEFLPIASYWLDTTLQTIPAGTYTDSTGTIIT